MSSKRTKNTKSRGSKSDGSRSRGGAKGSFAQRNQPAQRNQRSLYQRTDRVSVLVQEIVATELERIDDARLAGVAITDVEVDRELTTASVFFDVRNLQDLPEVEGALEQRRTRLQRALAAQASMRRTPKLSFKVDTSVAQAERIERILDQINSDQPNTGQPNTDQSNTGK